MSSLLDQYLRELNPANAVEDAIAKNYQRNVSLLDQKKIDLAGKTTEKQSRMDPQAALDAYMALGGGNESSNNIDVAQSSALGLFGDLSDAGKGISNAIFNTNFDDSEESGWSNQAIRDDVVGVSDEVRAGIQAQQQEVFNQIDQGNYWEAVKAGAIAAPGTISDSFGSLIALGIGGAPRMIGTGLVKGGGKLLSMGAKADKIEDVADVATDAVKANKVLSAKEAAKAVDAANATAKTTKAAAKVAEADRLQRSATIMEKTLSAAKAGGDSASRVSLMAAQIVQQNRNEYKAANNGEEPSFARVAADTVMTFATLMPTPWMIKNLFVPKLGAGKVIDAAGDVVKNPKLLQQFAQQGKDLIAYADKGAIPSMLERVGKGILAVGKAAGAEAAQEYAQTWAGILAVQVGTKEAQSLIDSVMEVTGDRKNQIQAATGGVLGMGAGGGIRAVTAVPSVAGGLAVDAGKGVVQKAGRTLAARAKNTLARNQTPEQVEALVAENTAREAEVKHVIKRNNKLIGRLHRAPSFKDVKDPITREMLINRAGDDQDLNDPEVFQKVSAKVASALKSEALTLRGSFVAIDAKRLGKTAYEATKQAAKDAAGYVGITPEVFDEYLGKAKKLSKAAIKEVKNLPDSGTRGLFMAVNDAGADTSKKGWKAVRGAAHGMAPKRIRQVAKAIESTLPDASAQLMEMADTREQLNVKADLHKETTVDSGNIPKGIKAAKQNQDPLDDGEANSLALELTDIAKGRIGDLDTVKAVTVALDKFITSDLYKSGKSHLNENGVENIRAFLAEAKEENSSAVAELAKDAKDKVKSATNSVVEFVDELIDGKSIKKAADEVLTSALKGTLFKSSEVKEITDPDSGATAEEIADKVSQMLEVGVGNVAAFFNKTAEEIKNRDASPEEKARLASELEVEKKSQTLGDFMLTNFFSVAGKTTDAAKKVYNAIAKEMPELNKADISKAVKAFQERIKSGDVVIPEPGVEAEAEAEVETKETTEKVVEKDSEEDMLHDPLVEEAYKALDDFIEDAKENFEAGAKEASKLAKEARILTSNFYEAGNKYKKSKENEANYLEQMPLLKVKITTTLMQIVVDKNPDFKPTDVAKIFYDEYLDDYSKAEILDMVKDAYGVKTRKKKDYSKEDLIEEVDPDTNRKLAMLKEPLTTDMVLEFAEDLDINICD